MDKNRNLYNAMEAIKRITGYKDQWHTADAKGDKNTANEAAKMAQTYYKMLVDSGYSDVADALKNTNNVGAKYIYDTFMKNNSAPTSTTPSTTTAPTTTTPTTTTPTETTPTTTPTNTSNGINIVESPDATDLSTADGMINDTYNIQRGDKATLSGKYDTLEKYIYSNPFEDDESKAIMGNYKFKGDIASKNAVASGGASNGGNIDSYASANANRQQLAFTNAGTQAVLDNFNSRISNLRGMLTEMGVNLQNHYKSMQDTIGLKQGEEQRQFENDETSKNNDVDRKVKISDVTGYAPDEWVASNNHYLNDDGTLKDEYKDYDFSAIMANAKASGNTEAYNEAAVARYYKIMGDYAKYGKYDDGNYSVPGKQKTESARQFDEQSRLTEHEIDTSAELTQAELASLEKRNSEDNATTLAKADKDNATSLAITDKELGAKVAEAEADVTWEEITKNINLSEDAESFLNAYIYPLWVNEETGNIKETIEKVKYDATNNPTGYKLTRNDVSKLLNLMGITKFKISDTETISASEWLDSQTWYEKVDV